MSGNTDFRNANMQTLKDSEMLRYFSEENPSFFVTLPRDDRDLREMKLPDNFINSLRESIPSKVILVLANGNETYVNFKKSEQSLCHMKEFNIDCRGLFGSTLIYSYKGNGKFFVNCLKDDLCEVIYFKNRTIPRSTFYDQDVMTGIGWKFLVFLNNTAFQNGEIPIPAHFWRAFGKLLPPKVQFYMRNGSRYEGTCSKTERKMYGLDDLVREYGLSETDEVLFTYFGEGNFFVMIFDTSNVEVMMLDQDSQSSESEIEIVDEPVQLPVNLEVDVHNNENMTFTVVMTASNMDNTSHGVYIPSYIESPNGQWIAGDMVNLRTAAGSWYVGVVKSGKMFRFSSGWNQFVRENEISLHETVVFQLMEEEQAVVFLVTFPHRP